MDDLLTQQINKLKKQTKISYILAGSGLTLALVFGILWLVSSSKSHDQKPNMTSTKVSLDTIDYANQLSDLTNKEEFQAKTIDSLRTVLFALEDSIKTLKLADETLSTTAPNEDYIYQMLENARRFSNTDCNKSLAFLYAAKKVANMEKRTGSNLDAIQSMIKKCEANVFGANPSASTE